MSIIKKITYLSLLALAPACSSVAAPPAPILQSAYDAKSSYLPTDKKPPTYEQGLIDGCQSGMVGAGGTYVKRSNIHDKRYNTAWKDGYDYCKSTNVPVMANKGALVLNNQST